METKLNCGSIFKNEKKSKDTHPDYNGTINVDGKEKQIALWLKEAKSGKKYFSVAISEPYKKEESSQNVNSKEIDESDLPF